ncbi:MAG: PIG-L family deacetylase [Acidobacteria bacterium]|nr:PIG-L family deacetylase [Acidobacteriota bacterium]
MRSEENEHLPFQAGTLPGQKILVLAPHPDDEVIGCGGFLALAAAEEKEISVVAVTDGSAAAGEDGQHVRASEMARGLATIGITGSPRFLGYSDRGVAGASDSLRTELREIIEELSPDLILVPSPLDIHPDHRAVARVLWRIFVAVPDSLPRLGSASVAFYETSVPFRPNVLVDITGVAEKKFAAIRAHESQIGHRDYEWFARGLAQYRALTLGSDVRFVEAFHLISVGDLASMPWSGLIDELGPKPEIRVLRDPLDISVIVRTRDRLDLLREALDSIRLGTPASEIVVVNDGGASPRDVIGSRNRVRLVENEQSRGRSVAMNIGVDSAATGFLMFLDDDDLHYPEHIDELGSEWDGKEVAIYSDALSAFWSMEASGRLMRDKTLRTYARDYDPDALLFDNYIPLPTLLMRRDDYLDLKGFDPAFDLFEDWDFLIRLSRRGPLRRIPRITCEIRHIENIGSAILGAGAGSDRFLDAKLAVWQKHEELIDLRVLARYISAEHARRQKLESIGWTESGRARHLEQETRTLASRVRESHETAAANAHHLGGRLQESETRRFALEGEVRTLRAELARVEADRKRFADAMDDRDRTMQAQFNEISRLNSLIDQMRGTKAWRAHDLFQKLKGIGRE